MSGETDLGRDEQVAALVAALASLVDEVPAERFAVIGGVAVLAALQGAHRVTDDVDTVAEQHGDAPTVIEVAMSGSTSSLKIDCIAVGDTPASGLPVAGLPADELDRAYVLAHRWA